jgi:outer membrane biosynthesis protein TonB
MILLLGACGSVPPPHPTNVTEQKSEVSGRRIEVGERLGTPRMIRYSRPAYPKQAKKAHIEGDVALDVVIAKTGEVREIQVIRPSDARRCSGRRGQELAIHPHLLERRTG